MTPEKVAHIMALLDQYVRACKGVTNYENVMAAKAVRDKLEAALRDAPQAEGWVMVPVEPTDAMIEAGCEVAARERALAENRRRFETAAVPLHSDFSTAGQELRIRYAAMLAATPSAPTAVEPPLKPGSVVMDSRGLYEVPHDPSVTVTTTRAEDTQPFVVEQARASKGTK